MQLSYGATQSSVLTGPDDPEDCRKLSFHKMIYHYALVLKIPTQGLNAWPSVS